MPHSFFLHLLLLFFSLGTLTKLQAQYSNWSTDSLENTLTSSQDPNQKAEIYYIIAKRVLYQNPEKAINYAQQSLKITPPKERLKLGNTYNVLASAHSILSKFSTAMSYADSAIVVFQQSNSEKGLSRSYLNKGIIFNQQNDYQKAASFYYKSLHISERLKDSVKIAFALNNLLSTHLVLKDYEQALKDAQQALAIHLKMNNQSEIAHSYSNVGIVHLNMENFDSALVYFNLAQPLFLADNKIANLMLVYADKASIYQQQNHINLALSNIDTAMFYAEQASLEQYFMPFYEQRASLLFKLNNFAKSIEVYTDLRHLAQKSNSLHYQYEAFNGLVRNYTALKEFEQALDSRNQAVIFKDSILSVEKQNQIKDLEVKYETAKKEHENQLLAQEKDLETLRADRNRQLLYLAILATLLILLIGGLLVRQYKINASHLTNQLKHRLLRNQMSPHFIFNALVAIQNFVYKKEPILAGEYLASFATLIRAILENSRSEYISLSKEIQWLENYLNLQLLRFDNSFDYNIHVEENIDLENMLIPPMLTQPFIENALEHGLKDINYRGQIQVNIAIKDQILHIEVQDNGIGLEASKLQNNSKKHQSLATTITKERLDFLNKKRGNKIYFDIKTLESKGTLVSFSMPLTYKY